MSQLLRTAFQALINWKLHAFFSTFISTDTKLILYILNGIVLIFIIQIGFISQICITTG